MDTRSPYTMKPGQICIRHWQALPLELRREFWKATNYGFDKVTAPLKKKMLAALRKKENSSG